LIVVKARQRIVNNPAAIATANFLVGIIVLLSIEKYWQGTRSTRKRDLPVLRLGNMGCEEIGWACKGALSYRHYMFNYAGGASRVPGENMGGECG
jgi:hypothetical protein